MESCFIDIFTIIFSNADRDGANMPKASWHDFFVHEINTQIYIFANPEFFSSSRVYSAIMFDSKNKSFIFMSESIHIHIYISIVRIFSVEWPGIHNYENNKMRNNFH